MLLALFVEPVALQSPASRPASAPARYSPSEIRIEHEVPIADPRTGDARPPCAAHDAGKACADHRHWRIVGGDRVHDAASLLSWFRSMARSGEAAKIRTEGLAPAEYLVLVLDRLRAAGFRSVEVVEGSTTVRFAMPAPVASRPSNWSTIRVRRAMPDRSPEMDVIPGREGDRDLLRDFVRGKESQSRPASSATLTVLVQPMRYASARDVVSIVHGLLRLGVRTFATESLDEPWRDEDGR